MLKTNFLFTISDGQVAPACVCVCVCLSRAILKAKVIGMNRWLIHLQHLFLLKLFLPSIHVYVLMRSSL